MKPSYQQVDAKKNENKGFILAKGKALVRGIFFEASFEKKEIYR